MTTAILTAWHRYTPYGSEFYAPILDFYLQNMKKYQNEFDMLYILDSNWNIDGIKDEWGINNIKIIKTDPSLRYYDAYKKVLPEIKEDLVLFIDNDMVIYREGIIKKLFDLLNDYDVVSIYESIGEYKTDKLNGKNKFTPYFFATRKE